MYSQNVSLVGLSEISFFIAARHYATVYWLYFKRLLLVGDVTTLNLSIYKNGEHTIIEMGDAYETLRYNILLYIFFNWLESWT